MSVARWVYRFRNYLASLPLIFAFAFNQYEIEAGGLIWPLAIVTVLAGIALRIWGQQHLHYRVGLRKELTITEIINDSVLYLVSQFSLHPNSSMKNPTLPIFLEKAPPKSYDVPDVKE